VKKSSKRDGKHVSALMESAKDMLKTGATPDVVTFVEETLAEIADIVIPAITSESSAQQALLYYHDSLIRDITDVHLPTWKRTISEWSVEVDLASTTHKTCRAEEHCLCYGEGVAEGNCCLDNNPDCGKRVCEMALYNLWTIWVNKETELRDVHVDIDDHFCPPGANGTTHAFRQASVPWMRDYMVKKVEVDEAEAAYDSYRGTTEHNNGCILEHNNLDAKSAICNAAQSDLETKACSESRAVHQALFDFERMWTFQHGERDMDLVNTRADELVRHEEYRQIKVVECLMERIHELNGRPCDEESGELDSELSHCHAEGEAIQVCEFGENTVPTRIAGVRYEVRDEAVRIAHGGSASDNPNGWKFFLPAEEPHVGAICLLYPEPPVRPPFCLVGGCSLEAGCTLYQDERCLPVAPPHPCDPLWTSAEITPLPGFPSAPFSETNPGCNAYPSCSACDLSEFDRVEAEHHIDTAVILVDGCFEQGTEVEREVAHIGDGRTGAVRCCSHAGDTCDTDHLPQGCQTDATFEHAVELCELNGERLCTQTEIEARVCCGTGCGHDNRKVWVARQGTTVYGR